MRISGRKLSILLFLVLLIALIIRILVLQFGNDDEDCLYQKVYDQWEETAVCRALPLLSFSGEEQPQTMRQLFHQMLAQAFPWYAYEKLYLVEPETEEGKDEPEPENQEENLQAGEDIPENPAPQEEGNQEEQEELKQIELSESEHSEDTTETKPEDSVQHPQPETQATPEQRIRNALADPWAVNIANLSSEPLFAQALIDNSWWDFNYLIHTWYTVDTSTDASVVGISTPELVTYPAGIQKGGQNGYDILIYHTHSLELYADSAQFAAPNGVIGAGEFLAKLLEEQYGYRVLHLTRSFDAEGRDYAYGKALPALKEVLAEHPEIQVVIDLHRDEVDSNAHLVQNVEGKEAARYMFFNGLSYTRNLGALAEFPNPYQKENLAVSYQLQLASDALFPGCARKIYLKGYRYNMHLRPRSILIELGAQNNTEQEAWNSCVLLAKMLDTVLSYSIR